MGRLLSCWLVVFEVMPEERDWLLERRIVKSKMGVGINDESNRGAFVLLPGNPHIILTSDHLPTSICRAHIIMFANQDQSRHGHISLEDSASRIERSGRLKFVFGRALNRAAFNCQKCLPGAQRKSNNGGAFGIDEMLLNKKI